MSAAFFVTGTDTDVGKTTIAAGLLCAARLAGLSTAAVKPVASGCEDGVDGLRNSDALALLAECSLPLSYAEVNPFSFAPAIARDGLRLAGWVANVLDPQTSRLDDNLRTLTERLAAPCLGRAPRLEQAGAAAVARHLDISLLGLAPASIGL